ncbi:HAD family hydrolase [Stagnimonas aquatica]|uniref:HAD family hydrolase n=1 Tax=Stagnimonas aquatica TaxID=2689987 RepID=A0A3N0VEJ3_9GAMM|nr:HAD-IA family hydrolase [Stagnimonas aquatica]ROH91111.1 HAD family hydrolase [Stagnimonas aquatica]
MSTSSPGRAARAFFFDLDGTLVDTAPDLGGAANHVRLSLGLPPLPLLDYRPVASAGARGLLGKALGISPEHADFPRHRDAFLAHYAEHLADQSPLFEGFETVLATYAAHGLAWGVMTNKPKRYTDALMAALGLDRRAAAVVSADEVAQAKPAPDGLLLACERAGLKPEDCWYVGDDQRDILAGRAAGMRTVAAAWGYEGPHPIHTWGAELILARPIDLLELIA